MRRLLQCSICALAAAGCLDFDQFAGDPPPGFPDRGAILDGSTPPPTDAGSPRGDLGPLCGKDGFAGCDGNKALFCVNGVVQRIDCQTTCSVELQMCADCGGKSTTCDNDKVFSCTSFGTLGMELECPAPVGDSSKPGCIDGDCIQCVPLQNADSVCGNGFNGTNANSEYSCINGKLGPPVQCPFGCDPQAGSCRELVPANDAANHLPMGDLWTCRTPAQNAMLPSLSSANVVKLTVDTSQGTVTGGNVMFATRFGDPYLPMGQHTPLRVLHVKSVDLPPGSTIDVVGKAGLVLLVDSSVSIGSLQDATPTVIALSDPNYAAGVMGLNTGNGEGGINLNSLGGGGGGGGHATHGGTGSGGQNAAAGGGYSNGAGTEILEAGGPGGAGFPQTAGGTGGGAIQITACNGITIHPGVAINASGNGGLGGTGPAGGGGGGGAGGTILLEAATVAANGWLAADGGGGGSGAGLLAQSNGLPGSTWLVMLQSGVVPGGAGPGAQGGSGASATGNPGNGGQPPQGTGGGGGGGATGLIFINQAPGVPKPIIPMSTPIPSVSTVCVSGQTCSY
jgi:hypothetical protein